MSQIPATACPTDGDFHTVGKNTKYQIPAGATDGDFYEVVKNTKYKMQNTKYDGMKSEIPADPTDRDFHKVVKNTKYQIRLYCKAKYLQAPQMGMFMRSWHRRQKRSFTMFAEIPGRLRT